MSINDLIVRNTLKKLPFVKWDRWVETPMGIQVYGWIERKDSYKDFVLISFESTLYWFTTSSALRTKEISELLGMDGKEHKSCNRIQDASWSKDVNCIRI